MLQHHCRKCGGVVCGPCSNKRFLLPNQSSKPLRVCLQCYDILSRAKTQSGNITLNNSKGINGNIYFKFKFIKHNYRAIINAVCSTF